jgi:hypothetical protein
MRSAHDQSITSHPKYSSFLKLGSPRNFLSRDFLRRPQIQITPHYAISQTSFAHQSMDSLISITEKFEPERIFNLDQESLSAEEIENVEKLYQQITEERMSCRLKSSESYEKKSSIEAASTLGDVEEYLKNRGRITEYVKLMNEQTILNGLTYHPSLSTTQSHTILSQNDNYAKYFDLEDAEYHLPLSHFTKLLGNEIPDLDMDILVGKLTSNPRDVIHEMGLYRTKIDNPDREAKITRVDEVTALALKKVFTAENEEEALKFAFIFGALRGYNIRSTTGACWAQEMSMRWIFAKKDWPQFNKMPGVYLDIEASILPEGERSFASLIDRQIRDYKASINAEEAIGEDSLFDRPITQEKDEFIRYLIETKSYREEDLPEIISYQTNDPAKPTSLDLIARLGDKRFFEILRKKIEEEPEIRDAITRQGANWDSVIDNAISYGDHTTIETIEELRCLAPQTVFKTAAGNALAESKTSQRIY